MDLKLRKMPKAPRGVPLLVKTRTGEYAVFKIERIWTGSDNFIGFYLLDDVLAAVELLRKMTPEGYEFTGEWRNAQPGEHYLIYVKGHESPRAVRCFSEPSMYKELILRKLPEPVEVRYEAEENRRHPKVGDWAWTENGWLEITTDRHTAYVCGLYLCARRVEVKRETR